MLDLRQPQASQATVTTSTYGANCGDLWLRRFWVGDRREPADCSHFVMVTPSASWLLGLEIKFKTIGAAHPENYYLLGLAQGGDTELTGAQLLGLCRPALCKAIADAAVAAAGATLPLASCVSAAAASNRGIQQEAVAAALTGSGTQQRANNNSGSSSGTTAACVQPKRQQQRPPC